MKKSLLSENLNNVMHSLSENPLKRIIKFICNYDKQDFLEIILTPIKTFQQVIEYAQDLNIPFSYSSNGDVFL